MSETPAKPSRTAFGPIALVLVGVLLIGYPLSAMPVAYMAGRGWIDKKTSHVPYRPLKNLLGGTPPGAVWMDGANACYFAGKRHAGP